MLTKWTVLTAVCTAALTFVGAAGWMLAAPSRDHRGATTSQPVGDSDSRAKPARSIPRKRAPKVSPAVVDAIEAERLGPARSPKDLERLVRATLSKARTRGRLTALDVEPAIAALDRSGFPQRRLAFEAELERLSQELEPDVISGPPQLGSLVATLSARGPVALSAEQRGLLLDELEEFPPSTQTEVLTQLMPPVPVSDRQVPVEPQPDL